MPANSPTVSAPLPRPTLPTSSGAQAVKALPAETPGPVEKMLTYADKVRGLQPPEVAGEISRIGEPFDPTTQMQLAIVLVQTRNPADTARALGLLQKVTASKDKDAPSLQPLARLLAARFMEQRKIEDDRDKQVQQQAQQLRDVQRRNEQLTERLEALRAIERSIAKPGGSAGAEAEPSLTFPPSAPASAKPKP